MKIILILLLSLQASAGVKDWWRGFCEHHLIAEDPYQDLERLETLYPQDSEEYIQALMTTYQRLGAKRAWGDKEKQTRLRAVGWELRRLVGHREDVQDLLSKYRRFE